MAAHGGVHVEQRSIGVEDIGRMMHGKSFAAASRAVQALIAVKYRWPQRFSAISVDVDPENIVLCQPEITHLDGKHDTGGGGANRDLDLCGRRLV
ncbi:hypothetical protein MPL3365_210050 [Mesorhizobium plurifarium]|uniref:Uncharacterized protein n=1 Tax=Mesorhizobium plurifarium TaxID=69974 RepID=A0A090G3H2_MESPL|nr:hypothetical protein MPL3365_210050 [Mesorhizobium plurifarium]